MSHAEAMSSMMRRPMVAYTYGFGGVVFRYNTKNRGSFQYKGNSDPQTRWANISRIGGWDMSACTATDWRQL